MKLRKGSLSYLILLSLEKASGFVDLNNFSYSAQMKALKGIPDSTSDKTLTETFRRLRLKGVIAYEKDTDGKIILRLTELGRQSLPEKHIPWDGRYRIVIWDIPESKKRIRNLLRRRLKEWGFKSWQKSVWVSKRNVTQKLRSLINELGVDEWVSVIESDDNTLHTLFDDRS
jgi:CRISPR-associated endonuclease Cas2